ncbi:MAG: helix-turn-helix domain-containing protein [Rhizobiaceae bacterium]
MTKAREIEIRRIGRQLRLLRENAGRSLEQLAAASGLSVRALRELEGGRTNPTLSTVVTAAEALGVGVDEIIAAARRDEPAADLTRTDDSRAAEVRLTRTLPDPRMKARLLDLSASGGSSIALPTGAVFVHVLSGAATATLENETVRLAPGDSFHAQPGMLRHLDGTQGQLLLVEASTLSIQDNA